jgi:drug/metabolite transporter (DMT)-like permease
MEHPPPPSVRRVTGTALRWLWIILGAVAAILYEAVMIMNAREIAATRPRNPIFLYVIVPAVIWAGFILFFNWIADRFDPEPPPQAPKG